MQKPISLLRDNQQNGWHFKGQQPTDKITQMRSAVSFKASRIMTLSSDPSYLIRRLLGRPGLFLGEGLPLQHKIRLISCATWRWQISFVSSGDVKACARSLRLGFPNSTPMSPKKSTITAGTKLSNLLRAFLLRKPTCRASLAAASAASSLCCNTATAPSNSSDRLASSCMRSCVTSHSSKGTRDKQKQLARDGQQPQRMRKVTPRVQSLQKHIPHTRQVFKGERPFVTVLL